MTAQRILVCLHDFHRGGTERVAIALARDWAAAGRDVTILCGDDGGGLRDTVDARVAVVRLDPPLRRGPLSRHRLGRAMGAMLRELRPNLIFLPGNFHLLLANALRAAAPDTVIAAKISNPPVPAGTGWPGRAFFRHAVRGVDGFAAMNAGLARELATLLPGRAVFTLHDPVAVAMPATIRDANKLAWIGRLEAQKDPELALRVIVELPDMHLIMLGDGALESRLRRRIAALGLQDRVTLTGHVPEVEPHLAGAAALLVTSRYEGGPAVAVEALALGVPVVSTDCSHLLQELLTVPEAGRIVASRDPAVLARALRAVTAAPPSPHILNALAAPFEPQPRAAAYLGWFDRLVHHG